VAVEAMEGGLVVVGWYDAVEEGRRVECGGRGEGCVVERSVIGCEQSVVCHRVEGGAERIWRLGDGLAGCLSPPGYRSRRRHKRVGAIWQSGQPN